MELRTARKPAGAAGGLKRAASTLEHPSSASSPQKLRSSSPAKKQAATAKSYTPKPKPLTPDEIKLQKIVERRREQRRKINRRYAERTGYAMTIMAFDRVKRMQSENDELDSNLQSMLQTVRDLQAKFIMKLEKREADIASGKVDPAEPAGKEHARQMTQWLAVVPSLLAHYEEQKEDWAANDRDLNHLTTVFNYVDQGNNSGAPGAVPPEPRELPDIVESSSESEDSDSESESESESESDDDSDVDDSDDYTDSEYYDSEYEGHSDAPEEVDE